MRSAIFGRATARSVGTGSTATALHQRQRRTDLEKDPGGNPIGRRWTMKNSLAVIQVKGKVLKFVAWIDHPDSDVAPVHTRSLGRFAVGLRRRSEAQPALPGYSCNAGQDVTCCSRRRSIARGVRAIPAAATAANWDCRFATGSGRIDLRSRFRISRIYFLIVFSRYARMVS